MMRDIRKNLHNEYEKGTAKRKRDLKSVREKYMKSVN